MRPKSRRLLSASKKATIVLLRAIIYQDIFMKDIESAILGFCVGDALGVPHEFKPRGYFKKNPVTGMEGYGTHNQPPGTWSDDSSMTLCTLDSLSNGYDIDDLASRFLEWYQDGKYTPYGEVFDIGISTREALSRISNGASPLVSGGRDERDNGNGSLMRILPLAFFLKDLEESDRFRIIGEVSSITHAHERSVLSCYAYAEFLTGLIHGMSIEDSMVGMRNGIRKCFGNSREISNFERILNADIISLNEDVIASSGYVVHTLEAALWSFVTTSDYRECVLRSVNLGNDTDTTAAVAGGIAGLYYGKDSIPSEWLSCLAGMEFITDLCRKFDG
jgi:ADP-ribosyl-[dinitrogen reductase] hydrolase